MKPVTIVGAGFSGLTLAYYLVREGVPVTIYDSKSTVGGLLNSVVTPEGLIETAANGVLANPEILQMWSELGLVAAEINPVRRKRYIFWRKPARWPISFLTTIRLIGFVLKKIFAPAVVAPRPDESTSEWATRVVDADFAERLLSPALQGIYAGDPKVMSARLVLAGFFKKGKRYPTSAPKDGMGAWMNALYQYLQNRGVRFELGREYVIPGPIEDPLVVATGVAAAGRLLEKNQPRLSGLLKRCKTLPLVSTTVFFEPQNSDVQGFGVLFARREQFNALGVLFNACIFHGRSQLRSETWIMGGANHPNPTALTDQQILDLILADRRRLSGDLDAQPPRLVRHQITRWPEALPHYTLEWADTLDELDVKPPLFLHGNYLGQIGLANLHARSQQLAMQIKEFSRG